MNGHSVIKKKYRKFKSKTSRLNDYLHYIFIPKIKAIIILIYFYLRNLLRIRDIYTSEREKKTPRKLKPG